MRDVGKSEFESQYQDIMLKLQEREITPDDYDMLLSLENCKNGKSLSSYLSNCIGGNKQEGPCDTCNVNSD